MGFAVLGISMPVFFLGPLALYIFWFKLGWLPGTGYYAARRVRVRRVVRPLDHAVVRARRPVRGVLRPAYALQPDGDDGGGLHPHGARQGPLREARGAASTGCGRASRRSSPCSAWISAALLGGAIITETIFNLPGIGQLTVQSVGSQDLNTIAVITLVAASFVVVANLIVDIVYAFLDPRVRPSVAVRTHA